MSVTIFEMFLCCLSFFNDVLIDGAAIVRVNLFVRSIATISDIKMVSRVHAADWLAKVITLTAGNAVLFVLVSLPSFTDLCVLCFTRSPVCNIESSVFGPCVFSPEV